MNIVPQDLSTILRSLGRAFVCRADGWTPELGVALELEHLGDTEGDVTIAHNAEVAGLTLPELTGPAFHEADFTGENPVVEMPLYLTSPALRATVSPSGLASGGLSARVPPIEHTLVIFPEGLILERDAQKKPHRYPLDYTAGNWTLNGVALTAAQLALLDMSVWFWRGFFNRPSRVFKGGPGDERKEIDTVSFQVEHHADMPEGHHLWTLGDPADAGIDIEGGS